MPEIAESQPACRRTVVGLGLAGCLLTAGALFIGLYGAPPEDRAVSAIVYALGVALPIGLGVFRLSHHRADRFAWFLVGTGFLWSVTTLSESGNSVLYSTGRTAIWLLEPAIVLLMLSFPFGRIETTLERRIGASRLAARRASLSPRSARIGG